MNATDQLSPREIVQRICQIEAMIRAAGYRRLDCLARGDMDDHALAYQRQRILLGMSGRLRALLREGR